MRRRDAGRQDRAVRAVRRLLALSRLQLHQEGRPAAARSAPVRGHLPQEQGRPPRAASRATHRERLLGVLQLPALRLHDEPRATRWPARCRRRPAGPQGRGGALPDLRLDQRHARGRHRPGRQVRRRPAEPRGARAPGTCPRWPARPVARRRAAAVHVAARGPAAARRPNALARSSRPPTRERGGGRPDDRSRPRAVPPLPRRARRLAAHPARLRDRRRLLPRLAGCAGHGLAAPDARRPAGIPGRPRGGARAVVRRAAARGHPFVPSLGHAERPRAG